MNSGEFDQSINICLRFSGRMNAMGNSIDLLSSNILENLGYNLKRKPLGAKISIFKKEREKIIDSIDNFYLFIDKLYEFNTNWIITKHGTPVGGKRNPTFYNDGFIYEFSPEKIHKVDLEFQEIMGILTIIWNKMSAGD